MLKIGILVWDVALGLCAIFILYILIPWGLKVLIRKNFLGTVKKSACVCLTFDDGPNPESTLKILQLLNEAKVKATFFVLGKNIELHPELASKIVELGHEIGVHSYRHTHPWKCSPFQSLNDLVRGTNAIRNYICSDNQILCRPPYGKLNLVTLLYVFFSRLRLVFWNVDPKDYKQESSDIVAQYVMEQISPGAVVLLHDGSRNSTRDIDITVMALKAILEETSDRRLTFITVSEALKKATQKNNNNREMGLE